ncbi:MAG: type II toxin-antitoxin system HicB family antitoxin [bacterium]|nr:type II toxin-antitoxin system HicB family antitoxin [bacterium]
MNYKFTSVITKEEKWYVARCIELGVVSQGKTIEKAQENLKEAAELYLKDDPNVKKLISKTSPLVSILELKHA